MHIIILTQCFPPQRGGIENVMAALAQGLVDAGMQVTVLADGEDPAASSLPYTVQWFSGPKPWRRWRKKLALHNLLTQHTDLGIITDSWKSALTAGDCLSKQHKKIPLLCLAHGNDVLTQGSLRRQYRIVQGLSQATRIVAVSEHTAKLVQGLKLPERRINVIHSPVPEPPDPPSATKQQAEQLFVEGAPRLLTIARIEPRKGHDQVIHSLPSLVKSFPQLSYVIAGEGPDRSRLEKLCEQLNVQSYVHFIGPVDDPMKTALLQAAHLFVMPVRYDDSHHSIEGFGISYIEAAYQQLPVLGGDSGGVRDAVISGQTGLLCDGNNPLSVSAALQQCLYHMDEMRDMAKVAKQEALRKCHVATVVQQYIALLQQGARRSTQPEKHMGLHSVNEDF